MKQHKSLLLIIVSLLYYISTGFAQKCNFPLSIYIENQLVDAPIGARQMLADQLKRIVISSGSSTTFTASQFGITASAVQLNRKVLAGPPTKSINTVGITLFVVDVINQTCLSEYYFESKGVGETDTKSLIQAFSSFKKYEENIKDFISEGKKKIIDYYDRQYPDIITEAKRLVSLRNYEEAIYLLSSIPSCSNGIDEANKLILDIYTKNLDLENSYILNSARTIWASGQDEASAKTASSLLALIDPDAACYKDAISLLFEIKKQVRSDIDFETREKYKDEVNLEKRRIEAARAVGVAFGNNQKPTTVNLLWLRR